MVFSKGLRPRIKSGEITSSIRIWKNARVKVGGRYPLEQGTIVVTAILELEPENLSDDLARETGFIDLADLITVAQHGSSQRIFRVDFEYLDFKQPG
jgi:hypothetical protein